MLAKRLFDIVFSSVALVILSPALLLVALLIKLDSRGDVFFCQMRNGKSGQVFKIIKYRTMRQAPDGKFEQCKPHDYRVTRLGKFLRRSSIDELPQLINVLLGQMSIVGPRPQCIEHDAEFVAILPRYMERYRVRPGLTGLAQIRGFRGPTPTVKEMWARLALDLQYVNRVSLWRDIEITLLTIPAILFPRQAF